MAKRVGSRPLTCTVCSGHKLLQGFNDLATVSPEVASAWHPTKNASPANETLISSGGAKWWLCELGHSWPATIRDRRRKGGACPFCIGRKCLSGFNDLATRAPAIAAEWDYEANGELRPDSVLGSSKASYGWRCARGHTWTAALRHRLTGTGCPQCSGSRVISGETDLETLFSTHAQLWHPTRNGDLTPRDVMPRSTRVVWWRCPRGHDFDSSVSSLMGARLNGHPGCPTCSSRRVSAGINDLATLKPDVAAEWHPEMNGDLRPTDVSPSSGRVVWWVCHRGHALELAISNKKPGQCSYCSGHRLLRGANDLETLYPELAKEWHPTKNGQTTARDVHKKASREVWWLCTKGHSYRRSPRARSQGQGCGECSRAGGSRIEREFFSAFEDRLDDARYDARVEVPWRKRKTCRVDVIGRVAGRRVAVEFDGRYFHRRAESFERDQAKTAALLAAGWFVVRIREGELPHLDMAHPGLVQVSFARGGKDYYHPRKIAECVDTVMVELNRRLLPAEAAA